ncbi:hypothetical protein DH2020_037644 [Rehmannia glutinosa]|uniref:Uncharacterized protein n=1 Tax=Rehmannia glutinosa TaxID=99300 RepID=A0ABR0V153_REHGL
MEGSRPSTPTNSKSILTAPPPRSATLKISSLQKDPPRQILAIITLLPIGGSLLGLAGITLSRNPNRARGGHTLFVILSLAKQNRIPDRGFRAYGAFVVLLGLQFLGKVTGRGCVEYAPARARGDYSGG